MTDNNIKQRRDFWMLPALWVTGVILFIPLLRNRFIADDYTALSIHRAFRGQPFLRTILYGGNDFLRPFNLTMVMLRGELFGPHPLPFVITNIVLHLANTSMVFLIARRIFAEFKYRTLAILTAAVFFLVAFSHYEGITWISSSITLFVTSFMLVSIYAHIRFRQTGRPGWLILTIAALILAFLTKETAVSLPFILLLYDLVCVKKRERRKRFFMPYIVYGVLLAAYLVVQTGFALRFAGGESVYRPGWHVLTNIADYWVWFWIPSPRHPYVAQVLSVLPRGALIVYWIAAGGVALTLPLLIVLAAIKKVRREILWGFLAIMLSLLVFLPFAIKISARYAYLPSVFVALLGGGLFSLLWKWLKDRAKRAWRTVTGIIAGLYLAGNVAGLLLVQREFVRVSTTTERLALEVGELVELRDEDVIFIEGLPPHVHLREAVQWYHNPYVHVHADNDKYQGTPKTLPDTKQLYKGSDANLYYMKVEDSKLLLVSSEPLSPESNVP